VTGAGVSESVPRHKVQARHARYSEIRKSVVGHFCGRESNCQILCRSLELIVWCFQKELNYLFGVSEKVLNYLFETPVVVTIRWHTPLP
jgi:hypothetical protein